MLCEDERLPRDVVARLEVTQRNAARLSTLVSDLLTVAQTQQRTLSIAPAPVDVAGLVREAVLTIRPWAEKAEVSLRLQAPEHVPAHLDAGRIRQVVDNLLSNGVKYTGAGGAVDVLVADQGDRVEIAVSDTGIGIAPDEVDRVFGRFFRGGEAMEKHIPGTGIGLSIVSAIVAAHDGRITVDSEPGRGSTFRVVLPRSERPGCTGRA
jgi:signal transduction histidine kinase